MNQCSVCGAESECFEVVSGGVLLFFDRVECALRGTAAACVQCGDTIFEEGLIIMGQNYCSEDCAFEQLDRQSLLPDLNSCEAMIDESKKEAMAVS